MTYYYCTRFFSLLTGRRRRRSCFNLLSKSFFCVYYHSDDDSAVKIVDSGTYAHLQNRMQMQAKLGNLDKVLETFILMKDFSAKPTIYDYNAMIHCYLNSPNVSAASVSEIIDSMQRYGPYPDANTYIITVNGLTSIGLLEDGIRFTEKMIASSFVPSSKVLSLLFNKLVKAGNLVGSDVVLTLMLNLGYTPTSFDVGAFIQGLCKAGLVKMAFEVFSTVSQNGNFTQGFVFDPILRSFCKYSKMNTALSFLGWLNKKGFILDVYSYTALVHGFSKRKLWGQVDHCLNEMKRAECKPDVVTCTVIIKSLCDCGKVDEGLKVLQEMEAEGCDPDVVTFSIILRELGYQGRSSEINSLLKVMEQKGLSPNSYTVAGIAGGMLQAGQVERVYVLLHNIISKGWCINDVVYNIFLNSICLLNGSKEALAMVPKMMDWGFRPCNVTYNTILKGLLTENDIDKSCRLCHHIKPANAPDLISFTIMLSSAAKREDSAMLRRILWRMECEGIKPNVMHMTCLLQYYSRIGDIQQCFHLLKFMLENDCRPNTVTLNTLLIGLCNKRLLGMAKWIFDYFKTLGISPDTATYDIMMRASIQDHNVSLVNELLEDMYG